MQKKTLSECVHTKELRPKYLNIVKAPVGSGKTYWALHVLAKQASAPSKVLYLIDTINGKNQLLAQNNVTSYSSEWFYVVTEDILLFDTTHADKIVVMTYGKFGSLSLQCSDLGKRFEYIICDEIHNLPHFSAFNINNPDANNFHEIAQVQLETTIKKTDTIVVGLSATPERAEKQMSCKIRHIPVDADVRELITKETHPYTNLQLLLQKQPKEEKGIVYIEQIEQMKEIWRAATNMGFCAIALWSKSNPNNPMSEEQLKALNHIVQYEALPEPYNLFIINASCETSINIHSPVDYIIVHKQEDEALIRVRGRYRGTLKRLYYLNYKIMPDFPPSSMGIRLYAKDRTQLCEQLNLRNESGRLRMWRSIETMLIANGYKVVQGKDKKGRYRIVSK